MDLINPPLFKVKLGKVWQGFIKQVRVGNVFCFRRGRKLFGVFTLYKLFLRRRRKRFWRFQTLQRQHYVGVRKYSPFSFLIMPT